MFRANGFLCGLRVIVASVCIASATKQNPFVKDGAQKHRPPPSKVIVRGYVTYFSKTTTGNTEQHRFKTENCSAAFSC